MILVLDAIAGIEIVLGRSKAKKLSALILVSEKVMSSELYKAETANALWKYIKLGFLKKDRGAELLSLAQGLVDEFIPIEWNNTESLNEAIRLDNSAYDMLYLTLARRTGACLVSVDKKLNALAKLEDLETY